MTLNDFIVRVGEDMVKCGPQYRYGQALYNVLHEVRPDLARLVHATEADPFYASNSDDQRIVKFWNIVTNNWGD